MWRENGDKVLVNGKTAVAESGAVVTVIIIANDTQVSRIIGRFAFAHIWDLLFVWLCKLFSKMRTLIICER